MLRFAYRRLLLAGAVTLTLSIVTFVLLYAGTDPAVALAGPDPSEERILQIRHELGLDLPLYIQYFDWLIGVLGGDLGQSWYWRQPVSELILEHAPVTFLLAFMAVTVTVLVALPLGIAAALKPNSTVDRL